MSSWAQIFTAYPGIWSERSYDRFSSSPFKKAQASEFKDWWPNQPPSTLRIIHPLKKDPRWGKIERDIEVAEHSGVGKWSVCQRYVVSLDSASEHAGNLYNDDEKWVIYTKLFFSVIGRPLHLMIKTIYFVSLCAFFKAIVDGVRKKEDAKQFGQRICRSIVDIVRTPIYGVVLLIVAIVALVAAPFKPTYLYDFRALTGQLSHELYWGKRYPLFMDLTPCMRRMGNLMDYTINPQQANNPLLKYADQNNPLLIALDNRGFGMISSL